MVIWTEKMGYMPNVCPYVCPYRYQVNRKASNDEGLQQITIFCIEMT